MPDPYLLRGKGTERLRVARTTSGLAVQLLVTGASGTTASFRVEPAKVQEVIGAIREAAGIDTIFVEVPDLDGAAEQITAIGAVSIAGATVCVVTECAHCGAPATTNVGPHAARYAAAVLVALANQADADPDPADVEQLAEAMFLDDMEEWQYGPEVPRVLGHDAKGLRYRRHALIALRHAARKGAQS